jgi:hypothetical protein
MFAAAMLYATPSLELSIYSTCKRISQKLMRNVVKFLNLIYKELHIRPMSIIRSNMEEFVIRGPDGENRVVNSYPSQVEYFLFFLIDLLKVLVCQLPCVAHGHVFRGACKFIH